MTLISYQFFLFFIVVVALYFAIPHKWRVLLLLTASCLFYISFIPIYILILFWMILVDYFVAIFLERINGKNNNLRKLLLVIGIFSTVSVLFIFKYYNFFNSNLDYIAKFFSWNYSIKTLELILPIGLSFHSLQSVAYVIEVYKRKQRAEKNFFIYALYIMYFPQLLAGPIERPQSMLPQFRIEQKFNYERVVNGLRLILWGAFQKIVIADRLAPVVNTVYNQPYMYTGFPLILATVLFAFEIFCDFAGYSNIARGAAAVMGINLTVNFNRPYFSKSITEFWRRWHISLSNWLRDYIYIPLGGNRVSKWRWHLNILLVFLISGLWHGSNYNFVIWGMLNGFYILAEGWTEKIRSRLTKFIQLPLTFSLICFAWIFFRANTVKEAFYIISHLSTNLIDQVRSLFNIDIDSFILFVNQNDKILGITFVDFLAVVFSLVLMESTHFLQRKNSVRIWFSTKPILLRWIVYYIIFILVLYYSTFKHEQFIYFQF